MAERIDELINKKIDIKAPTGVLEIMKRLETAGYEAFLVGGCVRDMFLCRVPSDYDITTNALPDEVEALFNSLPGYHTTAIGKEHGTIVVIVPREARPAEEPAIYEVTTYRIDGEYSDNRHPDSVTFTASLEEDLKRRDFTVNALAVDRRGKLVDCTGGLADLEAGIIRAVGDPAERFGEDSLRILRGVRFEAQLGFTMDAATEEAIHKGREMLHNIAAERIRVELDKTLASQGAAKALRKYRDVFAVFMPELAEGFDFDQQNPFHCYDVYEHTLHAVDAVRRPDQGARLLPEEFLITRLAALLHDLGKPRSFVVKDGWGHFYGHEHLSAEIAQDILERLRYDNRTKDDVIELVKIHGTVFNLDERYAKRKLNQLGEARLRMLIELERADVSAQSETVRGDRIERIDRFAEMVEGIIASNQCFSLRDLAVNGDDLIALGVKQGPEVGRVLKELLEMVMNEELENTKKALLERASESLGI